MNFSEKIHNKIALASDSFIFAFTLPSALHKFKKDNASIRFSYKHLDQAALIEKIIDEEVDIGLIGQPINHRKIQSEVCFEDSILLVCSKQKDCVIPEEIELQQLKDVPLLWTIGDKGLELALTKELIGSGVKPKDLNILMEIEDLPIMRMRRNI